MSVAREVTRALRRRVLPFLKASAPRRTGRLARSLAVRPYGDYGAVIGAVRGRYSRAAEKTAGRRHPGVYGYIVNQKGVHAGWFTRVTNRRVPPVMRRIAKRVSDIYLQGG